MKLTRRSGSDYFQRILSCLYLAVGLLFLGWNGPIILLSFWVEEVFAWGTIAIQRRIIIKKRKSNGLSCGDEDTPGMLSTNALYGIFMAFHLVMILVFIAIDAKTNTYSHQILSTFWGFLSFQKEYIYVPIVQDLGLMILLFILIGSIDLFRSIILRRRISLKALDERNRVVMSLPHITIILGIFALSLSPGKNWIIICLLARKCLCELILFPATECKESEQVESEIE